MREGRAPVRLSILHLSVDCGCLKLVFSQSLGQSCSSFLAFMSTEGLLRYLPSQFSVAIAIGFSKTVFSATAPSRSVTRSNIEQEDYA